MTLILREGKRKCGDCGRFKELDLFSRRSNHHTVSSYCKTCMVKRSTAYNKANKEKYNLYAKNYYLKRKNAKKENKEI